jgi:hypothetical protein
MVMGQEPRGVLGAVTMVSFEPEKVQVAWAGRLRQRAVAEVVADGSVTAYEADWPAVTAMDVGDSRGVVVAVGLAESISNWNELEAAVSFLMVMEAVPGWVKSVEGMSAVSWVGETKCVGRVELFQ